MKEDLIRLKKRIKHIDSGELTENYLAFYLCYAWPLQITPEQAFLAVRGRKKLPEPVDLTNDVILKAIDIIKDDSDATLDKLEKELQVNRYDLYFAIYKRLEEIRGDKERNRQMDKALFC